MRAQRLGDRGLIRWIDPEALSGEVLAAGIERAAGESRPALAARVSTIANRGVLTASDRLAALLPGDHDSRPDLAAAPDAG